MVKRLLKERGKKGRINGFVCLENALV